MTEMLEYWGVDKIHFDKKVRNIFKIETLLTVDIPLFRYPKCETKRRCLKEPH
jgi:hypothetical protein